ncbi:keratinocyte-associated protein 3 isoform X2 [Piliocolobus tephrosceles]|uniref:keratinocyte-associated protein 3 isoform X2 n=1 Tax=Piliocolobus tephrosceles TaxID=591936 RepID=UPI0013010E92|nr:keratinocyte-associated protein 3 isoform X2 [Piliocolobus tephrosceles]XP_031790059.1 keratinocyte-associated protein 3 isoform X2 [Piliocolobus tephrosceles]XP_031790060.1 keratinocyte-associated protein 3 isoform X2 [Piliocolobus tephrosceles]XP_031790061.1 keratinocyte-associated protein 3 isoform X2 [Piliocolobus tephrosceles]
MRRCSLCAFDAARGPRRLMRVGLALILVGHVNLLLGAVLHGTVLRHVANPRGAVTPEYTVANVISVGSGLLVSAAGGPGRGSGAQKAHQAKGFVSSTERFRGTCGSPGVQEPSSPSTGLLDPLVPLDEGPGHTDCPFDPTRIYVSTFSSFLWSTKPWSCPFNFPSLLHLPYSLSFLLFRIQPWLSGSLLCSCLQGRLLYLVTAVWLHSLYVELGPAGRRDFRGS